MADIIVIGILCGIGFWAFTQLRTRGSSCCGKGGSCSCCSKSCKSKTE